MTKEFKFSVFACSVNVIEGDNGSIGGQRIISESGISEAEFEFDGIGASFDSDTLRGIAKLIPADEVSILIAAFISPGSETE